MVPPISLARIISGRMHFKRIRKSPWLLAAIFTLLIPILISCSNGGGGDNNSSNIPSKPTGVTAVPGNGQVTISWSAVSGATSYNLYMATVTGVKKNNYSTLAGGMVHTGVTSPYVHTGLTNDVTYYFVVTAVNGDGESEESTESPAKPQTTLSKSSVIGTILLSSGGVSPASVRKAAISQADLVKNATVEIKSCKKGSALCEGSNLLDSAVVSTGNSGSYTASISLADEGGYVLINARKEGLTTFNKRIDYTTPTEINIQAELRTVNTVIVQAGEVLKASGNTKRAFRFGIVRYPNGVRKAMASPMLEISKAAANTQTELEITIPENSVSTNTLVAQLEAFDSSNPNDARSFPGDYVDSDGNRLVSLAFDYINITDENGTSVGDLVPQASKAEVEPTIITRWLPTGSCGNLLRDYDETKDGFQVPIYTYNPRSGLWIYLGIGTAVLYEDADNNGSNDLIPNAQVADKCREGVAYLDIEVSNEDFLSQWWNLDYPLIFDQPVILCIEKKFVDEDGNPLEGVYVSMYDSDTGSETDSNSFSYAWGVTDDTGTVKLKPVLLDGSTDRSATIEYYDYYTYLWGTESVTLGEYPACTTMTNTIVDPRGCSVEGDILEENGDPRADELVTVYGDSPTYFYNWANTDENGHFTMDVFCGQDLNVYSGADWELDRQFNVSGNITDWPVHEKTDDGTKVVLNDITVSNQAPYAWGYLSSYNIRQNNAITAYLWSWDYDGDYPMSYTITGSGILASGTFDSDAEWYKEVSITLDELGDHNLTFNVTDSAGKSSSSDLGTVTVSEEGANRPPEIVYAFPSKYSVTAVGEDVDFYSWAYDLDWDDLTYAWSVNGEQVCNEMSCTWKVPKDAVSGDMFNIHLLVSDGHGGTAEESFVIFFGQGTVDIIVQ